MLKYLFEYVDAEGRAGHDFVEAESVEDAGRRLADLGRGGRYRATRLLYDDLLAKLRQQRDGMEALDQASQSRVEAIAWRGSGSRALFVEFLRVNRWLIAAGVAAAGLGAATGQTWLFYVAGIGLLGLGAVFLFASRGASLYDALLRACALGKWAEVMRLTDRMAAVAAQSEQIALDLDVRRGMALAATGRLDEALALVGQWESRPIQPSGLYWDRLASVYAMAGDSGAFVDCMRRGFEASGEAAWARIDLALAMARVGEDPGAALELLRHPDIAVQPDSTLRFVHWARGIALLRLGDARGAEASLALAVEGFMTQAGNPVVWSVLALAVAALAVAGDANGKRERACALLTPLLPAFSACADPWLAEQVARFMPETPGSGCR